MTRPCARRQAEEKGGGGTRHRGSSEGLDSVGFGLMGKFIHGGKRGKDRSFGGADTRSLKFSPDEQTLAKEIDG